MMTILDLTHVLKEDIPIFPGTEPPTLEAACSCEKEGFAETKICMYSHVGTHMDAPAHLFTGFATLDQIPAAQFCGKAVVVDCTPDPQENAACAITMRDIAPHKALADQADFLLFHTGWSDKWDTGDYLLDRYPCMDAEVTEYLIRMGKKGVGVDCISIDRLHDGGLRNHRALLQTNSMVIIENLTHLKPLVGKLFYFFAMPLFYRKADGAPVRAIAIYEAL
ncbi:MAG: cyclase family protein [Clostridiales bacterium]|jgi:kynurenine formamidase|nr:cyclase family protein [Clostridiales bacterium]